MTEQTSQEERPKLQIDTEIIRKYPTFELFRRCIDYQAVKKVDDKYFPFEVDEEKLRKAVTELSQAFQDEKETNKQDLDVVAVPHGFNWQAEARQATRNAIDLIFKSRVISREVLSEASRSTGPGNVIVIEGQDYAFHNSHDWFTYLRHSRKDRSEGPLPIPENKKLRDQYVKLEIGTGIVKIYASEYLKIAKELGLALTIDQALRLDLTKEVGHEYAHGIERVIRLQGNKPTIRAQELGFVQLGDVPEHTYSKITGEYFARGFELFVVKGYLSGELGYSVEQVNKFVDRWQGQLQPRVTAAKTLMEHVKQAGYTSYEVIEIQEAIINKVRDLYDRDFALEIEDNDITNVLAYCEPPYTEEQLRALTKA